MSSRANQQNGRIAFRDAEPRDAEALTDVFLRAIESSVPGLPLAHTREEIIVWMATKQIPERSVTVAVSDRHPIGFAASGEGWIHQLFVEPIWHRQGVGTALLRGVIDHAVAPVRLWAFQRNVQARSFYERHGFHAELFTDGSDNEERTPDVLYVWRPRP